MKPVFVCLPYSPWSERAAWALDARHVDVETRRYQPLLGEVRLRALRRGAPGPASVPVLVWDGGVIGDSNAIARWANARGDGPDLFPDEPAVERWEAVAEQALQAGRALALARTLDDAGALDDLVPKGLRPLGPVARAIAAAGVRRTLRKYGASDLPPEVHRHRLVEALDAIRAGLREATGEPKTLLGAFSYADIAVAQALVFVSPPEPPPDGLPRPGIRIARSSRRAFRDPDLAEKYADLAAWRDALYATWRAA